MNHRKWRQLCFFILLNSDYFKSMVERKNSIEIKKKIDSDIFVDECQI